MRYITLRVPESCRSEVIGVLDDEKIDYVLTAEDGTEESAVVQFPLPKQAVESVLARLREAGLSEDNYTVVMTAESAQTPRFDRLEERYVEGSEDDARISHEELRATALEMTPGFVTYYAMTLLSAIVATAGLLLDSPTLVVGSMVIAPQVSSAMTANVGFALNDREMVRRGLGSLVYGLAVAVVGALLFAGALRAAAFVPPALEVTTLTQISQRASPGLLSLAVAVAAGAAGAFGIATALPVSLVGVMIAAAVIPAAAAVGVGIAAGQPAVALGAASLLVINALAINLVGVATLRLLGYRHTETPDQSRPVDRSTLLAVGAAVLLVTGGSGLAMAQQMAYENEVNQQVEDALSQDRYAELELREVRVEFNDRGLIEPDQEVTVVVSRPNDSLYPTLAGDVAEALGRRMDQQVAVEIEFVERQRATA